MVSRSDFWLVYIILLCICYWTSVRPVLGKYWSSFFLFFASLWTSPCTQSKTLQTKDETNISQYKPKQTSTIRFLLYTKGFPACCSREIWFPSPKSITCALSPVCPSINNILIAFKSCWSFNFGSCSSLSFDSVMLLTHSHLRKSLLAMWSLTWGQHS